MTENRPVNPFGLLRDTTGKNLTLVDEWRPTHFNKGICPMYQEELFMTKNGIIMAPISYVIYPWDQLEEIYEGSEFKIGNSLDCFQMNSKKCYNSVAVREHIVQYLNYFERFYDTDMEYLSILAKLKLSIEQGMYTMQNSDPEKEPIWLRHNFLNDLQRYILGSSLIPKAEQMVEDNYNIVLSKYTNKNNPSLQYTNEHAKMLFTMSLVMDMYIPLLTHFAKKARITDIDQFVLTAFTPIINMYPNVNMLAKLMETSTTNVNSNRNANGPLWDKQAIRGYNESIYSRVNVDNVILNIMPKYVFDKNIVNLNFSSIKKNINFKVTDISYEFNYVSLSSSNRDEDNNSDFDRFEADMVKQSEAKYLQVKINSHYTMDQIDSVFGPFSKDEIEYYRRHLSGQSNIVEFQKNLVFLFSYKYFGDTISPRSINNEDYIKLILTAKRFLSNKGLVVYPSVIGSNVGKIIARKSLNKSEMMKFETNQLYPEVRKRYRSNKPLEKLLSTAATIISSNFYNIDYYNQKLTGEPIPTISDMVIDETLQFALMI